MATELIITAKIVNHLNGQLLVESSNDDSQNACSYMIVLPLSTPQNHDETKPQESHAYSEATSRKWIVEPAVRDVEGGEQSAIKANFQESVIADEVRAEPDLLQPDAQHVDRSRPNQLNDSSRVHLRETQQPFKPID